MNDSRFPSVTALWFDAINRERRAPTLAEVIAAIPPTKIPDDPAMCVERALELLTRAGKLDNGWKAVLADPMSDLRGWLKQFAEFGEVG